MSPLPSEHSARLTDPNKYDRIRRQNDKFGEGIHAIWGIIGDKTELQAIRFSADKFTAAEAREWLKEHDYKPIEFEPASKANNNSINMETKDFPFELDKKSFKEDDEFFYFSGYAAIFNNLDLGGDIILPGAFTKSLRKRMPKLCYQHNLKDVIGVIKVCEENGKGLYIEAMMPKANQHCKDISVLIKCIALDSLSIGYDSINPEFSNGARYLKEIDLYEASPVTFSMNELSRIGVKSTVPFQDLPLADRDIVWDSTRAVARLRDFCDAKDEPNEKYMKGFLWFDEENPKNFTSYKLPIADIVDGTMKAIPRGIFAVAGVLQGARGGVDIPKADIEKIKNIISKYYRKMDLVAPWDEDNEKSTQIIENIKDIKEVNEFLRTKGFTNNERTLIIAKIKEVVGEARNEKAVNEILCNTEYHDSISTTMSNIRALLIEIKNEED